VSKQLFPLPAAQVRPAEDLAALAARINAEHEAGEGAARVGLGHFRTAGEALLKAKAQCGHGKWLPWLKQNVRFTQQTASNYMRVAKEWDKLLTVGNLRDALRLLTEDADDDEPPPPEYVTPDQWDEAGKEEEPAAEAGGDVWRVDKADCLDWLGSQPADGIDLVFGSPPYEDARLYLEGGEDRGIARATEEWVSWMVEVYRAALRCCRGLVAFVVEGRTKDYSWSGTPALLMADLLRGGIVLRKPPIYRRVGIPGSGGPDWLRNDWEFVVCATRPGPLPWSDNTAMGHAPKYAPGGDPSHRQQDGSRVNGPVAYATSEERSNVGPHRARRRAGRVYRPPEKANPGNVIDCGAVGGGNMGDPLCHENEAPFPESLAEFFVRSFCPHGGVVCDPFSGSGTTGAVAVRLGRRFLGCDLRESQARLARRRLDSEFARAAAALTRRQRRSGGR
jgi:site-specific DNA-methyltransferase (cytosine-N4-specific)